MRNLKTSTVLGKEFNYLRISNINEFLSSYSSNFEYYASSFQILYELEKRIMFKNNPDDCMLINYKEDGYIIFRLKEMKEENNLRVVVYEYEGSAS